MAEEKTTYEEHLRTFVENALAPKRVKTDSGEVEQHTLADQIKALEKIKAEEVQTKTPALSRLGVYQIANMNE